MAENEWIDGIYYAGPGGALLKEEWLLNEDGEWHYFDADGYVVRSGWYTVGETEYYFSDSKMVANEIRELYRYDEELQEGGWKWYQFDANGKATVLTDGWALDGEDWMYFEEGEPVYNAVVAIDGKEYAFESYYLVEEDAWVEAYSEKDGYYAYFSVNADGTVNRTPGWDTAGGRQVFIQNDGTLRTGWLYVGGRWYYMAPYMYKNTFATIGGRTYYFDSEGSYTEVYEDGFQILGTELVYYFEYGIPAQGWRLIGGNWYYFDPEMFTDGIYDIGEDRYYFDQNGIMQTGWIKDSGGNVLYADESGHLASGLTTIDGTTYCFVDWGYLVTDSTWYDYENDVAYLLDADGAVVAKTTDEPGWKHHNGKWYYLSENEYFYDTGWYTIAGEEGEVEYYFEDYVMVADEIYGGSYYGPNGALFKDGWFHKDGKWYYANEYGGLYNDGLYYIDDDGDEDYNDGDYYCFKGYEMYVGSVVYGSDILVTDASGRVVALQPFNEGWNWVKKFGYGAYYYVQDGELYEGWLGDYYLSYEGMYSGTVAEVDGTVYYFQDNGLIARNGWVYIEFYDTWLYAKESGELYCDEWALIGGTWYYFNGVEMLEDGDYWVEGKLHSFAEGGAWLGEASEEPEYADGWVMIDGNWNYVQNGYIVTSGIRKIDGVWYGFDYEGLVKNGFNSNGYYMNGSGVMVPYTGWQLINGKWCYFTAEHCLATGWFTVDGVQYYGQADGIATGYASAYENYGNAKLYFFDEGGALQGEVTADGWYANGETWYYVMNGELVCNEVVTIDGVQYSFDGRGRMQTNTIEYDGVGYCLFGANGARVTTESWHLFFDTVWLYVDDEGYLCIGTHIIGGTTYYFNFFGF